MPGNECYWRNTLKLQEVPWINDHKLGQTVVFPATAYLAMAIEGLRQMNESLTGTIILKQVHLLNLLVLKPEVDGVEISMQLEPARISTITNSNRWWRFQICSQDSDNLIVHANGLIAMNSSQTATSLTKGSFWLPATSTEKQATKTWYNKLASEGLCFGPEFHSLIAMYTDRNRTVLGTIAETLCKTGGLFNGHQESSYIIHPVTLDAILQAGIIGTAAGKFQDFKGKVPVFIGELELLLGNSTTNSELCTIRTSSEVVGFESCKIQGDLENARGQIIAQFKDIRAISYRELTLQNDGSQERNPLMRVLWKPDLATMWQKDTGAFAWYLDQFRSLFSQKNTEVNTAYLAGALDLISHNNGNVKVHKLDNNDKTRLEAIIDAADIGASHSKYEPCTRAMFIPGGKGKGIKGVLICSVSSSSQLCDLS
jgi:acyl transferase domain-containing protein